MNDGLEQKIVRLLEEKGPLTGSEILERIRERNFLLWRTCYLSSKLDIRTLGTRYLRLDQKVDGYARLSPSILREFMTYTLVGVSGAREGLDRRADRILRHIREVSQSKFALAHSIATRLQNDLNDRWPREGRLCFILAGDIVYDMAHDVPRPEASTGELVNGSDIDLVVVADDTVPDDFLEGLDGAIYREKYRTLISPGVREELDYVVKKMERVREQLGFDTFKRMVACKILREGALLLGSESLFREIKTLLVRSGVVEKLEEMEKQAGALRRRAEEHLLQTDPSRIVEEDLNHFHTSEETEEFE
ncbi:MAG TPA: hypothetical protein PLM79_09955 [Syntrophobacteraceae bacterium]|nr:hypothetical protein [Syntrophobacteraceae bacterium]